jgi:iron-sulfur cluster repair protein YtfE (RIC family)
LLAFRENHVHPTADPDQSDQANELFARLVDTSDTAVKTRERLFSELKEELELLASLEEKHLFPVLRKHKETKGLVADALHDNSQTRKLLAELEQTPKNTEEFASKVTELRKTFSSMSVMRRRSSFRRSSRL